MNADIDPAILKQMEHLALELGLEGLSDHRTKCLLKALYGLRQALKLKSVSIAEGVLMEPACKIRSMPLSSRARLLQSMT